MKEEDDKYCMIDGIPREIILKDILKELETYKKALKLACKDIFYERCAHCIMNNGSMYDECDACSTPYDYIDRYLQKAKKE